MYVCVCMAVTERQINQAVNNGAKTLKDLKRELGVASQCGSCAGCAKQCLRKAHQPSSELLRLSASNLAAA